MNYNDKGHQNYTDKIDTLGNRIGQLENELTEAKYLSSELLKSLEQANKQIEHISKQQLSVHEVVAKGRDFDTKLEILDTKSGPGGVSITVAGNSL